MGASLKRDVWDGIISCGAAIDELGISFRNSFCPKIGNGDDILFWKDEWCEAGLRLMDKFPRLYALEVDQNCSLSARWRLVDGNWCVQWNWKVNPRGRSLSVVSDLTNLVMNLTLPEGCCDGWFWHLNSNNLFSVKKLSNIIYSRLSMGQCLGKKTHAWNPLIPRKVNIFVWRAVLDRLPVLTKIDTRGIDIPTVLCPLCEEVPESLDHILIACPKVKLIWRKCFSWWGVKFPDGGMDFTDVINGSFCQHISSHLHKVFQGVCFVTMWAVWKLRNKMVHSRVEDKLAVGSEDIFAVIQSNTLLWISNRFPKGQFNWKAWITNPSSFHPTVVGVG
ncbi:reverse transcriptase domain, Reverse transcriptase zinc-binding domain protein [Artemisia annua]|uniref:Reverse transcriptase domain, Reverse transcriptase zinc-binding domain protein n=1 Tax=Artemisia annua TaxID=35608 RepID=A0A2U1KRZ7_ARTAN|nr:reverse transcriptase domain, Reverse transcriptase zinc-binding domain protein [Artemisia annua]